jgi:hypothetical protein
MQRLRRLALPLTLLTLGGSTAAGAQAATFIAFLTNAQENPPAVPTLATGGPRPTSFGVATFTLNAERTALTFVATIHNLDFTGTQTADPNDNLGAAHIHAGPAVTPTTNGPVVWGFLGTPFNDVNSSSAANCTAFASGVGGTCSATWDAGEGNGGTNLAAQLPIIFNGMSYINYHTTQFPGGEIRGAITLTPEPATVALLGSGLVALGLVARRRRSGSA